MWDIVFWFNKETVDYVPTKWEIQPGRYKWPTGISSTLIEKLIETCDPLEKVKYRICKRNAKRKNMRSLSEAQSICEQALFTSSIETETDDEDAALSGSSCGKLI